MGFDFNVSGHGRGDCGCHNGSMEAGALLAVGYERRGRLRSLPGCVLSVAQDLSRDCIMEHTSKRLFALVVWRENSQCLSYDSGGTAMSRRIRLGEVPCSPSQVCPPLDRHDGGARPNENEARCEGHEGGDICRSMYLDPSQEESGPRVDARFYGPICT